MNKVSIIFSTLLIVFVTVYATAVENYEYFTQAQSLYGPTGNIQTFSPFVLPRNTWSFGLHRFITGINYGPMTNLETGINFDLHDMAALLSVDEESFGAKVKKIYFHAKYSLLKSQRNGIDAAAGLQRETVYLAGGKHFASLMDTTLQAGIAGDGKTLNTFVALTQTTKWQQFLAEYSSRENRCNLGMRFVLSPEMKLDFFLTDITQLKNVFFDNFVFGITVTGGL